MVGQACVAYLKEADAPFLHEHSLLREVLEVEGIVEQVLLQSHKELAKLDRTLAQDLQLRQDHPET